MADRVNKALLLSSQTEFTSNLVIVKTPAQLIIASTAGGFYKKIALHHPNPDRNSPSDLSDNKAVETNPTN